MEGGEDGGSRREIGSDGWMDGGREGEREGGMEGWREGGGGGAALATALAAAVATCVCVCVCASPIALSHSSHVCPSGGSNACVRAKWLLFVVATLLDSFLYFRFVCLLPLCVALLASRSSSTFGARFKSNGVQAGAPVRTGRCRAAWQVLARDNASRGWCYCLCPRARR